MAFAVCASPSLSCRDALGNYKSALQERLQADHLGVPIYKLKSESGPDHRKRFLVEVRLKPAAAEPGKPLARGTGTTKKHAEQDAARRALARLNKTGNRSLPILPAYPQTSIQDVASAELRDNDRRGRPMAQPREESAAE